MREGGGGREGNAGREGEGKEGEIWGGTFTLFGMVT